MTTAKILADSINGTGSRLTTFEVEVPKYVLGQLAKHRQLSMNFESSRAKPFWRVLEQVVHDPYIPTRFGKYSSGMQPVGYFNQNEVIGIIEEWVTSAHSAAHQAIDVGYRDDDQGVYSEAHRRLRLAVWNGKTLDWFKDNPPEVAKELLNRILEPYMKVKGVVSATEWDNFIQLRANPEAQDDINYLAQDINRLLAENNPTFVSAGACHLPDLGKNPTEVVENIARVSYGNHRSTTKREPGALYEQLAESGHWSPFEHVALVQGNGKSNFHSSWTQLRQILGGN